MPDSTFATEFFKSLIFSETSSRFSFSDYFAHTYGRTYDFCGTLPYLLCRGDVSVTAPFSCETAGLNAFCLLYTKKGAGKLLCDDMILPPPKLLGNFCQAPSPLSTAGKSIGSSVCTIYGNIRSALSARRSAPTIIKSWNPLAAVSSDWKKTPTPFLCGNAF